MIEQEIGLGSLCALGRTQCPPSTLAVGLAQAWTWDRAVNQIFWDIIHSCIVILCFMGATERADNRSSFPASSLIVNPCSMI